MNKTNSYEENTLAYYKNRFGEHTSPLTLTLEEQSRWNAIKKMISPTPSLQILDFGCGDGRFSNLLSEYGTVTGVDIVPTSIKKAKKNFPAIKFLTLDCTQPNITKHFDIKYDLIISSEVIEHLLNQEQYIKNATQLLKPGGHLILTTPDKRWYNAFFSNKNIEPQAYEFWLSKNQLKYLVTDNNLKIITHFNFRSEWIFSFKSTFFLNCIGNRYVHFLLRKLGLKSLVLSILNQFNIGIYQLVLAQK